MDVSKIESQAKDDNTSQPSISADFETALSATGYGWYHFFLLLTSIPMIFTPMLASSLMAYVVPNAECDLELTLLDKGVLNAVSYGGMILGAVGWAHISDTKGRRKIMIIGFFLDVLFVLCEAFSQNVLQLEIFRFIEGCIVSGPFAISMTYLLEMHAKRYRPMVMIAVGIIMQITTLMFPFIAIATMSPHYNLNILGLNIRPWQIFIAVSGIPSLLSGLLLIFFHESPKFLMSKGRNEEAIKVFQTIYSVNHNASRNDYPIKQLIEENTQKTKSGIDQSLQIFKKPHLGLTIHVCLTNFCLLFCVNAFRLWVPQLFVSLSDYEYDFPQSQMSVCSVIEYSVNKSQVFIELIDGLEKTCEAEMNVEGYMKNAYVGITGIIGYSIAGIFVIWFGRKNIMLVTALIALGAILTIILANVSNVLVIACCILVCSGSIISTSIIDVAAVNFPTTLRTVIIALNATVGRLGSLLGNLTFPITMQVHCLSPFMMMAILFGISFVSIIFMPNTKKGQLK